MAIHLSLERFPYANKKLSHFFFFSLEGRRQRRVSASLEEMSNVSRRKRCGWRKNRLSFLSFLRGTERRDWALTCHMSHPRRITSHKVTLPHLVFLLIFHLFPDISNLRNVLLFEKTRAIRKFQVVLWIFTGQSLNVD